MTTFAAHNPQTPSSNARSTARGLRRANEENGAVTGDSRRATARSHGGGTQVPRRSPSRRKNCVMSGSGSGTDLPKKRYHLAQEQGGNFRWRTQRTEETRPGAPGKVQGNSGPSGYSWSGRLDLNQRP